ncbi:hypothetical protein ADL03_41805 [Nocardia sp. NRRL S-836]|nr:hypothetical protein ADL03_41805 [Nocardia sp. NRRL S-836]
MPSNGAADPGAKQIRVFVYGTLRRGCFNYDRILKGRTAAEEPAWIAGVTLYDAGGFPFAVVDPAKPDNVVVGEVMTIDLAEHPRVLRDLDELEGFDPQDPANLYQRAEVTVKTNTGPVQAWIYQAGPNAEQEFTAADAIPGGDWVMFTSQQ